MSALPVHHVRRAPEELKEIEAIGDVEAQQQQGYGRYSPLNLQVAINLSPCQSSLL
jgi:hypothetical protein